MYDIDSMLDFTAKMDPYVIFTVKTQEKTSTVAQGIVLAIFRSSCTFQSICV